METGRVIRLSTTSFPRFFAVLSRVRGEIRSVGAEGATLETLTPAGPARVIVPPGAITKKIKFGLMAQKVPPEAVKLLDRKKGLVDVFPVVGIYPRRRKFHKPLQVQSHEPALVKRHMSKA